MYQTKSRIIKNYCVCGDYWRCIVDAGLIARKAKAGQFLTIRLSDGLKPFLRRPFSVHNVSGEKIEILYEVRGDGTRILSEKKKGDLLDIIGPLGNGFNYSCPGKGRNGGSIILVSGGIGIAPMLFLCRMIKNKSKTILIGARTKEQVLCEKEFKSLGCEVKIATDDGSLGFKGRVTQLLGRVIDSGPSVFDHIYACGPKPMIKSVCDIAKKNIIQTQDSKEEHMSCGIGVCLGCVIKTNDGLKRVCKDGPVFNAECLVW